MTKALETLRRLQRRSRESLQETRTPAGWAPRPRSSLSVSPGPPERPAETPEDFLQRIRDAYARVGALYHEGLRESLTEAEERVLDEPEERMEEALRAGDLEAAGAALVKWERRWTETIRARRGEE